MITSKDNAALLKPIEFEIIESNREFIALNKEIGIECRTEKKKDLKKKTFDHVGFLIDIYFEGDHLIPDDLRRKFENLRQFIDRDKTNVGTVMYLSKY